MNFKKFYKGLSNMSGTNNLQSKIFVFLVWVFYAKWVYLIRGIKERKVLKHDNKG